MSQPHQPRRYRVQRKDRAPLIAFMINALRQAGCRIIHEPEPDHAPFRITFETPSGERMGIIAYAFLATFTPTTNRPGDEHSFQIKYGSKDGRLHQLWQDPFGVYVTLLIGINPKQGFFVAADPVVHNPTKFFIRVEFKEEHVEQIRSNGWHAWERKKLKSSGGDPVEVLVGGTSSSFLRLVQFEREALGEDQGHRQMLAEHAVAKLPNMSSPPTALAVPPARLHALASELALTESEVLDVIASARRLKMAVRGWVAEEHLVRHLRTVPGVTECVRPDEEGGVDVRLRYQGSQPLTIECKNVLRDTDKNGLARIDFQRTRASKGNKCSRYYSLDDFDMVAACLHAVTERWEFKFTPTSALDRFEKEHLCTGRLSNRVRIDQRWKPGVAGVLRQLTAG